MSTRIVIDERGKSRHVFEIKVALFINSMQRNELLYLTKTFKDIKRFTKQLSLASETLPVRPKSFMRAVPDQARVTGHLLELLQDPEVRRLDATVHFLSGVNDKYHYPLLNRAQPIEAARTSNLMMDVSGSMAAGFLSREEESELFRDTLYNRSYGLDESCSFNLVDDR